MHPTLSVERAERQLDPWHTFWRGYQALEKRDVERILLSAGVLRREIKILDLGSELLVISNEDSMFH